MSSRIDHQGVSTKVGTPKEVRALLSKSHADRVLVAPVDRDSLNRVEVCLKSLQKELTSQQVHTLFGSPMEVREQLSGSRADRFMVVLLGNASQSYKTAFEDNLARVSSIIRELPERRDRESLERLVEVLVPHTPPSPRLLKEAAMLARARKALLESGDWLTSAQVASLAGLSSRNPSAQPNKWKKQGHIFAISHMGVDYFPAYGLNRDNEFRPLKSLTKIITLFAGKKDGWGMAYWFGSDNSFLGGRRPQDLLASEPDLIMAAAEDEIQEVAHG